MAIDTIFIRRIRLDASIGLLDWERAKPQPIEVDVEADVETSELIRTGDLNHGLNFNVIADTVRSLVHQGHVDLAEVLADRIATALLHQTQALRVVVEIRKFVPFSALADHVGVRVDRTRE